MSDKLLHTIEHSNETSLELTKAVLEMSRAERKNTTTLCITFIICIVIVVFGFNCFMNSKAFDYSDVKSTENININSAKGGN